MEGKTIELDNDLVVGRQDTDLEIEDLELSRKHAVIRRSSGRVQVEDLGSKNGTFVDGQRITEPTLVGGGAEIKIGVTTLVVEGVLPVSAPSDQPIADTTKTAVHSVPREMQSAPAGPAAAGAGAAAASAAPPSAPAAPGAPAAPALAGGPTPSMPLGEFRPPRERHERGLNSRSWLPVFASFGTALLTAAGLVVYFGVR
jgi:hypothetical protein